MKAKVLKFGAVIIVRYNDETYNDMPVFNVIFEARQVNIGHIFFRKNLPLEGYAFYPARDVSFGSVSLNDISECIKAADKCNGIFPDAIETELTYKNKNYEFQC